MKIEATMLAPDGFSSTFVPIVIEIPLVLQVQGCKVTSFTASPADLGTEVYTVGELSRTAFGYSAIQDPACGYTVTSVLAVQNPVTDVLPDTSFFELQGGF